LRDRWGEREPAFPVYLLAVGLLPFRWLSPIGSFQAHSEWSDLLIAVATVLWLARRLRRRTLGHAWRRWQLPLGAYLGLACVSAALVVPGRGGSPKDVVLMLELALMAVLTADFASDSWQRRAIARVIVASALLTVVLGAVGLILFYAHVPSGLSGVYGEQLSPSRVFTRIRAGLQTPPLLASYCIFASGVTASADAGLSRRVRIMAQVGLLLLCAATVSRGLIGFVVAMVIRSATRLTPQRRRIVVTTVTLAGLAVIAFLAVGRFHVDLHAHTPITYTVPDPGNRREAFATSLQTLEHHPLVGIGPGALPGVNAGQPFRAHFTPLNIAATLGVPALIMFLAMLWLLWRDRRRLTDLAYWSALAGMALDGLAQDVDHFRHLWVMFGLVGSNRPGSEEPAQGHPVAMRPPTTSPTKPEPTPFRRRP
jgi:hypothetical protein